MSGVGIQWVAVAGSPARKAWKEGKSRISILAVGAEMRMRGMSSDNDDDVDTVPLEFLAWDALSISESQ